MCALQCQPQPYIRGQNMHGRTSRHRTCGTKSTHDYQPFTSWHVRPRLLHRPRQQQQSQPHVTTAALPEAAVGIDLGTTNSAIAVFRAGDTAAKLLTDPSGSSIIPSVVAYTDRSGQPLIGAVAKRQAAANPLNTFYSVKRLIGKRAADVQGEPLVYKVAPAADGSVQLLCPARGGAIAPQQVSGDMLNHLLGMAQVELGWRPSSAVITIPAYFSQQQRAATLEAAELAGLKQVSLVQEPVAAALAYGFGKPLAADTLLVFDLGGGTYDVSVVESFEGIMEVLACGGNPRLGGDDFDRALVNWLLQSCLTDPAAAAAVRADPAAGAMLLEAAERAKVSLSGQQTTAIHLPFLPAGVSIDCSLTRGQLEQLVDPLLGTLQPPLAAVADECRLAYAGQFDWHSSDPATAGAGSSSSSSSNGSQHDSSSSSSQPLVKDKYAPKPRQLTAVVLVGGASRMPAVRRGLQQLTGLQPRCEIDPEAVVALGAAAHAAVLEGLSSGVEVMDGGYVQAVHGRATGVAAAGFNPAV